MDLRDLESNTRDGVHVASLAGSWLACVAGFGGLRDDGPVLHFAPALPTGLTRLAFNVRWHKLRLRVEFDHETITFTLRDGQGKEPMRVTVYDEELVLLADTSVTRPMRERKPTTPAPLQPIGRAPMRSSGLTSS